MLRTADLDYHLPQDLIAVRPAEPRDAARLLIVRRGAADPAPQHRLVRDLPELLDPGDLLIFNTTRVLPARFHGTRAGTGGKIEGLYLHEASLHHLTGLLIPDPPDPAATPGPAWIALIKGRHTRPGTILDLHDRAGRTSGIRLIVLGRPADEPEAWIVRILPGAPASTRDILARIGHTPLPPYIRKARRERGIADQPDDPDRYQTVFAKPADSSSPDATPGSVAAPTAGLHFTPELLARLEARGIQRAQVILHVGAGTFRPIETEFVEDHPIHAEWCSLPTPALRQLRAARAQGRRIIPVGTTAVRTLESFAPIIEAAAEPPPWLATRLLITPGYRFRWCDALLTNFHLPRSSLMALVAAMLEDPRAAPGSGINRLQTLYTHAIAHRYRFYSFGDAMLIL